MRRDAIVYVAVRSITPTDHLMADDIEQPPRGYTTDDVETQKTEPKRKGFLRRHLGKLAILMVIAIPVLGLGLWAAIALGFTYSEGERVGYVQKISEKGWLCKSWEGELAMANIPGAMPEIFKFSARDEEVARNINALSGKQVALRYEQHKGVPTSCFGETEYYVDGVRPLVK